MRSGKFPGVSPGHSHAAPESVLGKADSEQDGPGTTDQQGAAEVFASSSLRQVPTPSSRDEPDGTFTL